MDWIKTTDFLLHTRIPLEEVKHFPTLCDIKKYIINIDVRNLYRQVSF